METTDKIKTNTLIETDRLVLREFTPDDAAFVLELVTSPGWLKFIGDRGIRTIADAKAYIETILQKSYRVNGYGLYHVALHSGHKPVGMCGFVKRDYLDVADIGFAFLPDYTGQGLAFEAATATLDFSANELGFTGIAAITNTDNINSIKLLNKIGLQFEKLITVPPKGEELMLFTGSQEALRKGE